MATSPKKTGTRRTAGNSVNSSSNKNSRSSSRTSKTSSAKRTTKTSAGNKKTVDTKIRREALILLLFCVVLVLFLCMIGVIKGAFGPAIKGFMLGIFGILSYVIPIIVFLAICFQIANKGNNVATLKLVSGIFFLFMIGTILCFVTGMKIDLISESKSLVKDLYTYQGGGGLIFGLVACGLYKVFGKAGTIILAIVFAIICLVILTEKSFIKLMQSSGRKIYDTAKAGKREFDEITGYEDDEDIEVDDDYDAKIAERKRRAKIKREQEAEERARRQSIKEEREEARREAKREAKLELQNRKEEERKRKLEEEENKRKEEDLLDDERILRNSTKTKLSTSYFDIPGLEENDITNSKDDIHEIMLNPVKDSLNSGSTSSGMLLENNQILKEKTSGESLKEILLEDDLFDNKNLRKKNDDLNSSITDEKNINDTVIEDINIDTIEIETEHQVISSNLQDDDVTKIEILNETDEIKPVERLSSFSNVSRDEMKIISQNSDNNSTLNIEKPIENLADISAMPEPVTARTHEQNSSLLNSVTPPKPKLIHKKKYEYPSTNLLRINNNKNKGDSDQLLKETALRLQQTLKTFGVAVTVTDISQGPSVTRYELQLGEGIKVNKIVNLADDIKLNLAAQDIRIEAPIPGKAAVGIEIPNKETSEVLIRELLDSSEFANSASKMTFAVGKDISGKTIVADIAKMPHMLIAGATGSGKSVCINTLIMSVLYKASPDEVKLIMIDPKVVELSVYNGIPHLMIPVVTDPKKASAALQWAVNEMTKRYKLFADYSVRDLKGYNAKIKPEVNPEDPDAPKILPQIIVIVDELADLMMVASKEVEEAICRLAQLARAAGIHLIIATQRPSVDVITGLIKANMPSRVAFKVTSGVDSRTILDMIGAEKLLGKGDMLFFPQGYPKPLRVQGAFVSDGEVESVVEFLKSNAGDDVYDEEVEKQISGISNPEAQNTSSDGGNNKASAYDDYFVEACRFVVEKEKASSGMLQRVFKIGFNRAGRIVDQMEEAGVVGPEEGTKPRKVLMNKEELEEFLRIYSSDN